MIYGKFSIFFVYIYFFVDKLMNRRSQFDKFKKYKSIKKIRKSFSHLRSTACILNEKDLHPSIFLNSLEPLSNL
jgi:hypothetical protein